MAQRIRLLAALLAILTLVGARPVGAADFDAHFAGWETPTGLFPDEVSAEFTVPVVSGGGLADWVGLSGASEVFQAGAVVSPIYGDNCWWEDYPFDDQQVIPGVRCAPGDLIFADVSQAYFGWTQSRVIVEDLTTGQSSGWLSVYTPDLAYSPSAEVFVEANTSLGPWPPSFGPIGIEDPLATSGGFLFQGGQTKTFATMNAENEVEPIDNLCSVIPGVTLSANWPANDLGIAA